VRDRHQEDDQGDDLSGAFGRQNLSPIGMGRERSSLPAASSNRTPEAAAGGDSSPDCGTPQALPAAGKAAPVSAAVPSLR